MSDKDEDQKNRRFNEDIERKEYSDYTHERDEPTPPPPQERKTTKEE